MQKIDLRKIEKEFYGPSPKIVQEIEIPEFHFLMVDGQGDPGTSSAYKAAVECLFAFSYNLKFHVKKTQEVDYSVMPLEGLWWADDPEVFIRGERDQWQWTMMIRQPKWVDAEMVESIREIVAKKKPELDFDQVRYQAWQEGLCAQIMHIGPFTEEGPTIEKLHQHIQSKGKLRGKHHEIYLSDIRRAAPEKWKTIIRQPFA